MKMTGSMGPKVSVIITTHNRSELLIRAVNSVLNQIYSNFEIIIVDDGSSDNTREVVASLDDSRIRLLVHEKNQGASSARNTGIAQARGEHIAFLDDDDEWFPAKLEGQVAILDVSSPVVGLVYGWMDIYEDSTDRLVQGARKILEGDISQDLLALNIPGSTSTLLVRSSVAKNVGGFNENLSRRDDADFICRISQEYHIAVLPKVVGLFHIEHGKDRISDNSPVRLSEEIRFLKYHLAKYADELNSLPCALASVLRELAVAEMMRAERTAAISAFLSSVKLHPVSKETFNHVFLLTKVFIWYATPLSRVRNRARAIRDKFRQREVNLR